MLRVARHTTPEAFLDRGRLRLARGEAEHAIFFAICDRLATAGEAERHAAYLITVEDDDEVVAVALETPGRKWVTTGAPEGAVAAMVQHLWGQRWPVPGILGPHATATTFARFWEETTGRALRAGRSQRIFELRAVKAPRPTPGRCRAAETAEHDALAEWARAFALDVATDESPDEVAATVRRRLDGVELYVWEDGQPVAMAATAQGPPNGAGVSLVYTPPAFRGRGYASALVAALSARLLASGKHFCFLFTDLANPTSNRIYTRIGYRSVAEWTDYFPA